MPPVTKNLLIINLLVFLASLAVRGINMDFTGLFGLHFVLASQFQPWQLLTYMFLHANFEHIFFNMFALWMFGRVIEQVLGSRRFLIYYLICGMGAGVMQELAQTVSFYLSDISQYPMNLIAPYLNSWTTVGASGAVYGVLLAFGYIFPNERMFIIPIPFPIKAKYFVVGYALIELLSVVARSNDGVAHVAHLGGMLFGWMLLRRWKSHPYDSWTNEILGKLRARFRGEGRERKSTRYERREHSGRFTDEMDYNARKQARQAEVDRILAKVKQHGYGSLTEDEKRKLFDASNE